MGRRSLKQQRAEEILTAFERCVAKHGLDGATLERVAELAGVGRPAIRHNVGNRDALIAAALERIVSRHKANFAAVTDELPEEDRVDTLLRYLFVGPFVGPLDEEDAVLDELFAVRHRDPKVAHLLAETYRELESVITNELVREYPRAGRARCRSVAYLLMVLSYGHSTFEGLGIGRRRGKAGLEHARSLAATLAERS